MSLDTVSISYQIDGTTNDGEVVSFSTKGSLPVAGVVQNRLTVSASIGVWDVGASGDAPFNTAVFINDGSADAQVQVVCGTGEALSLALPAGAILSLPFQITENTDVSVDTITLIPYTSQTTTVRYFIFL